MKQSRLLTLFNKIDKPLARLTKDRETERERERERRSGGGKESGREKERLRNYYYQE